MSATRQEILVVCLVESSVTLLHEWNDVLIGYISPLLQRIAGAAVAKSSKNDFRIGFVSYSDPHIHPNPILARRFFSSPLQLTKELRDDPASLGLGRTASGTRRGMAILEGYVAVFEMFDALSDTRPPKLRPPSPNEVSSETSLYEPAYYLIHVASSPPNKAIRPEWNTNPALDALNWASIPSELLKRKIRSSMILTRPIVELLEMYSHISRNPEPFWQSLIRPSHKLLFSGLPPKETKTVPQKRAVMDNHEVPPHPPPRPMSQEEQAGPVPAIPPAVANTSSTLHSSVNIVPSRTESATSGPPATESQPQPQPPPPPQLPPQSQPQTLPQAVPLRPSPLAQNLDPVKLLNFIRVIEVECQNKLSALTAARAAGRPQAELDSMQTELSQKVMNRSKLFALYQQVVQRQQPGGSTFPNQNATQPNPQQMHQGQGMVQAQQSRPSQEQTDVHMVPPSNAGPSQSSPSRGVNISSANFGVPNVVNKNPFQNVPISARPGMEAQMQKMLAERTRPPVLAAAPQSQPQPQLLPQNHAPLAQGNANFSNTNPNVADIMTPRMSMGPHLRRWQGALAWPSNPVSATARKENQIGIALFSQQSNLRAESWPQKLFLQPSRCTFNMQQIQTWNKELNPTMALISSTPILGNLEATTLNMRLFRQLRDVIQQKNMFAYCKFDIAGGPPGTGFLTFPMSSSMQGDVLIAMVFHASPMPASLIGQAPPSQVPPDAGGSSDVVPPPMITSGAPLSLQNLSPDVKAYLQQRQAAAQAAYNHQQLTQQQAQQKGMMSNPTGTTPGSTFNIAQFMQNMPAGGENSMSGLNIPPAPALQQVQHRQPLGFNPGQMGSLQMLPYAMNRGPDKDQGQ